MISDRLLEHEQILYFNFKYVFLHQALIILWCLYLWGKIILVFAEFDIYIQVPLTLHLSIFFIIFCAIDERMYSSLRLLL